MAALASGLQIIRKAAFAPQPWKNGGGITREAMRVPPIGDPFHWRVSVAHIEASGPFSEFAAHRRKMALLRGAGIELRFDDGGKKTLRRVGELVEFDGALRVDCELLNGPCVDLNLMVLKSAAATARVEYVAAELEVPSAPGETLLIFPIDRGISLATAEGKLVALDAWDLAVLSQGGERACRIAPGGAASSAGPAGAPAGVFVAVLGPL